MAPFVVPHLVVIIGILPYLATMASGWSQRPFASPKISGHALCKIPGENGLLLFGGLLSDRTATNALWQYSNGEWKAVESKNKKEGPGPRMYATASALEEDGLVYIVGGWDPEEKGSGGSFKDEIWSINPQTLEWKLCGQLPCGPISRHTGVTVGNCIVIGTYKPGDEGVVVLKAGGTCQLQPTTGEAPVGLSMCSAAALNDHQMILFGGSTKTQQLSDAVYLLDTKKWEWTKLTLTTAAAKEGTTSTPAPTASSCMAPVDATSVLIFGGAGIKPTGYEGGSGLMATPNTWLLSVDANGQTAHWKLCNSDSDDDEAKHPRGRVAASLHPIPGISTSEFLLTGGWDPATAETFEDSWTWSM
jgi:hypothetical protein